MRIVVRVALALLATVVILAFDSHHGASMGAWHAVVLYSLLWLMMVSDEGRD